jgi:hypothetical protein
VKSSTILVLALIVALGALFAALHYRNRARNRLQPSDDTGLIGSAAVNFQRGLFYLWIVVSVAWILIVGSNSRVWCTFGDQSALWCGEHEIYAEEVWGELASVFAVPLAVLIAGAGLLWAARGFRRN